MVSLAPRTKAKACATRLEQDRSAVPPLRGRGAIHAGSATELKYHLLLAEDLELAKPHEYKEQAQRTTEVKRMLTFLVQKLTADR